MRSRSLFAIGAVVALGFVASSAPVSATFPGPLGRIAFVSDRAGDLDIWTMNPDGSGAMNVTDAAGAPAFNLEPDWSPDGTRIAFRSGSGATAEIYIVNADGTELTQLTDNPFKDYAPVWSPDGSTIAFASNRNDPNFATCVGLFTGCNNDIFVMPATGGPPVQITVDSGSDHFPQFSPDGESIAYVSDMGGTSAIYTVDLDTVTTTKLTPDTLRAGPPDYSPDGTKIAFENNFYPCTTGNADCRTDVFVMNADGSSITQLTGKFRNNADPCWSPDGGTIVFTHSNSAQFNPQQIYEMNPDGTGTARVTPVNDNAFGPDWGPG